MDVPPAESLWHPKVTNVAVKDRVASNGSIFTGYSIGEKYYFNKVTGVDTWTTPEGQHEARQAPPPCPSLPPPAMPTTSRGDVACTREVGPLPTTPPPPPYKQPDGTRCLTDPFTYSSGETSQRTGDTLLYTPNKQLCVFWAKAIHSNTWQGRKAWRTFCQATNYSQVLDPDHYSSDDLWNWILSLPEDVNKGILPQDRSPSWRPRNDPAPASTTQARQQSQPRPSQTKQKPQPISAWRTLCHGTRRGTNQADHTKPKPDTGNYGIGRTVKDKQVTHKKKSHKPRSPYLQKLNSTD